ncbi:MAG TPA: pyridoxamine 5'-phosphate oxidase family protein [Candidatus Nitrosotalea sp.]|nr:pyridoxamine 5'-phosphate oxidase family protein [Candidatus Nitrosotalea sp.]
MIRRGFIRDQKVLRIATVDGRGTPHVVPVWYRYSQGKFYIGTNTRTAKARNVRRNPKVSFLIDVGVNSPDIYGVMGTGRARLIVERSRVKSVAKSILRRYFKTLENRSAQQLLDDTDCIIEVTPKKMTSWNY